MDHNHLTIKTYMAIMADRDAAIRDRNLALEERKRAFAERDMAMLQRDAAITERNAALNERNEAIAALHFRESAMNGNNMTPPDSPGHGIGGGGDYIHHHHQQQAYHASHFQEAAHNHREIPSSSTYHSTGVPSEATKPKKAKQAKETKINPTKASSKSSAKGKRGPEAMNNQIIAATSYGMKNEMESGSEGEDMERQLVMWKDDIGLNQIDFDDSAMPTPVCSCTGVPQPCYKWGNGGWQSACCTASMSMYPLPQLSNKRHSRVGGRKMSGNVFNKLLSRLVTEGYDLSTPLDLKEHWCKHATSRYSLPK